MKKIVLASKSPRRKEILEKFIDEFQCLDVDIDEKFDRDETPEQIVMGLSLQKALEGARKVEIDSIVIASDTIVYMDEVLCKPENYEDAFRMLKKLSGGIHSVYTGIAVVLTGTNRKFVAYNETKVKMHELSDETIKKYIDSGEVWDKAGSYGIQGKGSILVEKIEGDFFSVMGLPISLLGKLLKEHFDISLL